MTKPKKSLSWQLFRKELVEQMTQLAESDYITLEIHNSKSPENAFVQFRINSKETLWCEAVSNVWIPSPDFIDNHQIATLKKLGWKGPGYSGNWWQKLKGKTRFARGSALLIQAAREVYFAEHPSDLQYSASIPLANFSIDRADRCAPIHGKKRENADLIISIGDEIYGVSEDGVVSIGWRGEHFRISIETIGPVSILRAAIHIDSRKKRQKHTIVTKKLTSFVQYETDHQVIYREDEESSGFWLVSIKSLDKEDIDEDTIRMQLFALVIDVKWVRAFLRYISGD